MEEQLVEKPKSKTGIVIAIVLVVLCCCALILAAIGVAAYEFYQQVPPISGYDPLGPPLQPQWWKLPARRWSMFRSTRLKRFRTTIVPENNPRELACRLEGKCNIPETMSPPPGPRQVGEQDTVLGNKRGIQ